MRHSRHKFSLGTKTPENYIFLTHFSVLAVVWVKIISKSQQHPFSTPPGLGRFVSMAGGEFKVCLVLKHP